MHKFVYGGQETGKREQHKRAWRWKEPTVLEESGEVKHSWTGQEEGWKMRVG